MYFYNNFMELNEMLLIFIRKMLKQVITFIFKGLKEAFENVLSLY